MRHKSKSNRLGVKTAHRLALLRNLTKALVEHGRIKTTTVRAKQLRSFVEPLVTRLKDPTVHNLRQVNAELADRVATLSIAQKISPQFKTRPGGYLRILKLAKPRAGDQADMSLIEWVEESMVPKYSEMKEGKASSGKKAVKKSKKSLVKKAASKDSKEAETDLTAEKKSTKKKATKKDE